MPPTLGPNLLTDSGFEDGLPGWTEGGQTTGSGGAVNIGVDNNPLDVHSGSLGLFAGNAYTTTLSQTVATIVGHTYQVSFFLDVYQADATNGELTLTFGGTTAVDLKEPAETDQNSPPFTEYSASVVATGTSSLLQFSFIDPPGFFGVDDVSVNEVLCFLAGTHIRTTRGEVKVEDLVVGEDVVVVGEHPATRPIRWIGHRTVSRRFADPLRCLPIRIRTGALGDNLPARDLLVSPCHALLIGDVLVQAGAIVNGRTVTRERRMPETFVYYHVELEDHALILAEGVPAETFIDNADRMAFDNWPEHVALYPAGYDMRELEIPRAASWRQVPMAVRRRLALLAGDAGENPAAVA